MRDALAGTPKALAPVAGRPFIEHVIRFLSRRGVLDVIVCTGVGADAIESALGDGSRLGVKLVYSREDQPLGTGGAVRRAASLARTPRWLVLNGDSLIDVDLAGLVAHHAARRARATLALARVPDSGRYGAVRLDADHRVVEFVEKPNTATPGLINAGVCVLERDVLELIPAEGLASLERDVFPRLIGAGLHGMVVDAGFVDIGTADAYLAVRDAPEALLRIAG